VIIQRLTQYLLSFFLKKISLNEWRDKKLSFLEHGLSQDLEKGRYWQANFQIFRIYFSAAHVVHTRNNFHPWDSILLEIGCGPEAHQKNLLAAYPHDSLSLVYLDFKWQNTSQENAWLKEKSYSSIKQDAWKFTAHMIARDLEIAKELTSKYLRSVQGQQIDPNLFQQEERAIQWLKTSWLVLTKSFESFESVAKTTNKISDQEKLLSSRHEVTFKTSKPGDEKSEVLSWHFYCLGLYHVFTWSIQGLSVVVYQFPQGEFSVAHHKSLASVLINQQEEEKIQTKLQQQFKVQVPQVVDLIINLFNDWSAAMDKRY